MTHPEQAEFTKWAEKFKGFGKYGRASAWAAWNARAAIQASSLTAEERAEGLKRLKAATPGPWEFWDEVFPSPPDYDDAHEPAQVGIQDGDPLLSLDDGYVAKEKVAANGELIEWLVNHAEKLLGVQSPEPPEPVGEPQFGEKRMCVYTKCDSCGGGEWTEAAADNMKCYGCGKQICQACCDTGAHGENHGSGYPHQVVRELREQARLYNADMMKVREQRDKAIKQAMGSGDSFDLMWDEICKWFDRVIPHSAEDDVEKFREESAEFLANPCAEEAADALMCLVHWAWLKGVDIKAAIREKHEKNTKRAWERQPNGTWKHVR